jgi:hypothetical protein
MKKNPEVFDLNDEEFASLIEEVLENDEPAPPSDYCDYYDDMYWGCND